MLISDLNIPQSLQQTLLKKGYSKLYPPQKKALKKGLLEGKNLVISAPTASGKTLVAEIAAVKKALEEKGKTIYLTPLRSLAAEKYKDFREKYEEIGVKTAISTGDFDSTDEWLKNFDVIICTNEKADSLSRHNSKVLCEASVVVIDEIHLIGSTRRGPTLEILTTKLLEENPDAQFIALSATIKNSNEIARWLRAELVHSTWRPVELREGISYNHEIHFKNGLKRKVETITGNLKIDLGIETITGGGQVLYFENKRKSTENLARKVSVAIEKCLDEKERKELLEIAEQAKNKSNNTKMEEKLVECLKKGVAFHHAGLNHYHRELIEEFFRRNKIKVICATPTLAAGVNLPARRVIISSYTRYEELYGMTPIPVMEYKQMAGRAGRPQYDEYGEAIIVAKSREESNILRYKYLDSPIEEITSHLGEEESLRTHVLALASSPRINKRKKLIETMEKTFYASREGGKKVKRKTLKTLEFLEKKGFIRAEGEIIYPTAIGKRTSELYIDPLTTLVFLESIKKQVNLKDEFKILQVACITPDMEKIRIKRKYREEAEEILEKCNVIIPETLIEQEYSPEQILRGTWTAYLLLKWINEETYENMAETFNVGPGDIQRIIENAVWITYSYSEITRLTKNGEGRKNILDVSKRVKYGVKPELLELVNLEEVGRIRARTLYDNGYKTIKDLEKASLKELERLPGIGRNLAKKILSQIKTIEEE